MHKIHAPAFGGARWYGCWSPMQRDVCPAPDSHAERHPLQSIEPSHSFPIHEPALTPEPHPDPQIPKPLSGMRQILNAQPEGRLILRSTLSIHEARPNWASRQARAPLT